MKILVVNAGSSSLKYQLIDSETEKAIAKGGCERIGIAGSLLKHKTAKGEVATPAKAEIIAPDTVRVYADSPEGVRYAFYQAVSPSLATLYNESAIPCPTFAHNCGNIPQLTFGKMD